MQGGGPPNEVEDSSLLFNSLKVYLNNKNRLQPIIGLRSITECVNVDTAGTEALYLCEVCICRLGITDIRNHIMGSLHRYNYIKARHPRFVTDWNNNANLSKLAWPLLEMARILEKREGPGDVQVLKVKAELYKKMETYSETKAISLLNTIKLRWEQRESQGISEDLCTTQSHRIVLSPKMHPVRSKKPNVQPRRAIVQEQKVSVQMSEHPPLMESTACLSVWPSALQSTGSNMNKLLDGYEGAKPLIGLSLVVACWGEEDDHLYCFLCHCCRIKSIKDDIIDHLTSSSHYSNYMVEIHPGEVDVMRGEESGDNQFLQSVAKRVEQEEGRGKIKVMGLPASLCNQLRSNSYHWCAMMLSGHRNRTSINIMKRKMAAKGPDVGAVKASEENTKHRQTTVLFKRAKRAGRKRTDGNVTKPVFKVSLPLSGGSMLLKRISFSPDSLPVSPEPSPAATAMSNPFSPELQTDGSVFNTSPLTVDLDEHNIRVRITSQSERSFSRQDQYAVWERELNDTRYQNADEPFADSQCSGKMENTAGTRKCLQRSAHNWQPAFKAKKKSNAALLQLDSQDVGVSDNVVSGINNTYVESNDYGMRYAEGGLVGSQDGHEEGSYRDDEGLRAQMCHMQNLPSYSSCQRGEEGFPEGKHQYISDYQSQVGIRDNMPRPGRQGEMSSNSAYQQYHQHQPQQPYQEQEYTCPPSDGTWYHSPASNMVPYLDVHRCNMDLHGDSVIQGRDVAEPRMQLFEVRQGLQSSDGVQLYASYNQTAPPTTMIAPPSYITMTTGYQILPLGHGMNSDPYSTVNLDLHPQSTDNAGWLERQSRVFVSLGQAQAFEALPDHYSRGIDSSLLVQMNARDDC
ncbi:uncharacterized protein si:ch211-199g17.2 [Lampris incognitus]|uniref:uncharacterized protein si:ch211-199g17.2 n=1 Tax=Lampris incognitus TaxID=2546036 RepID=UPI0024B5E053|nr:uncharacterized protein si:ch211-199g17.2 [Lampris incognitus]XP_056154198.1 uncharacterized protein si:ch211-199g17.2 [Lampris incognitus]